MQKVIFDANNLVGIPNRRKVPVAAALHHLVEQIELIIGEVVLLLEVLNRLSQVGKGAIVVRLLLLRLSTSG